MAVGTALNKAAGVALGMAAISLMAGRRLWLAVVHPAIAALAGVRALVDEYFICS
jgi:hypothetical protein